MTVYDAAKKIWNYMLMHHDLAKADVIFVLGSRDTRVALYAAPLYREGWAPLVLFTGSGSIHNHKPWRSEFVGTTEAAVFADIAAREGVPCEAILIEDRSQNTGENFEFGLRVLEERGVVPTRVMLVQKPYMERRTYAAAKVWLSNIELIVTSPPISFEAYPDERRTFEQLVHALVGDLQRINEYPVRGFQIVQDIPADVWDAYEYLVAQGYTDRLITA